MNKEPELELEPDEEEVLDLVKAPLRSSHVPPRQGRASSADAPSETTPTTEAGATADGAIAQMLPPHSPSSPPPTRFSTAAPLAPPRPNALGAPTRPSNVPPAPRIPASQAAEKIAELQEQLEQTKRNLAARDAEIRTLLTQRDARIAELEAVKSQLAAREFGIKELEFAVLAKETKVRDLEKELESLQSPG